MPEILFRGKRKDNGEWVVGFFAKFGLFPFIGALNSYGSMLWFEVDPATVGQFSGVTDDNDLKIFDGDILMIRFETDSFPECTSAVWAELAKAVYSNKYHGWYAVFENGEEYSLWEYDGEDGVVVVGNVHDNPEMLKGGAEECV